VIFSRSVDTIHAVISCHQASDPRHLEQSNSRPDRVWYDLTCRLCDGEEDRQQINRNMPKARNPVSGRFVLPFSGAFPISSLPPNALRGAQNLTDR